MSKEGSVRDAYERLLAIKLPEEAQMRHIYRPGWDRADGRQKMTSVQAIKTKVAAILAQKLRKVG